MRENDEKRPYWPKLQYSVPCLRVEQHEDGSLTFHRSFGGMTWRLQDVQFREDDVLRAQVVIANCWVDGVGRYSERTAITDLDGNELASSSIHIVELTDDIRRHTLEEVVEVPVTPRSSGYFRIRVILEDQIYLEYPIRIKVQTLQPSGRLQ